jgi:UDP-N-acetylglucosamine 3-dehydrogenase
MGTTKLGLIGLGYIGRIHLMNCLKLQNANLIAVADVSKKALSKAKSLGIPNLYEDYNELLKNPDVEAVIIALPTQLHAKCAEAASEYNKDILLEKPIARTVKEGKDILFSARKHNVKLMIGHYLRYVEENKALKAQIERGELGEIQVAYAVNIASGPFMHRADADAPKPVPDWWWDKEMTGGGALIDLGCHMIDLTRWFFGEVSDAKSYLGYRYNLDQEDHALCTIKFEAGQIGIINVGWFSQQSQERLDVHGTMGHASVAHISPSKVITGLKLILRQTPGFFVPFRKEVESFADCIQNGVQPQPSGEDGLKTLEVIEQAYAHRIEMGLPPSLKKIG